MTDEFVIENDRSSPKGGSGRRSCLVIGLIVLAAVVALIVVIGFGVASLGDGSTWAVGKAVGVVEVQGVIMDSGPVIATLEEYRRSENIHAVLLRVDSPGGGVAASQEIYQEVVRLNKEKPVIVSMGSFAASGGLYISAPADTIIANPGTITGSIGVIMQLLNLQELIGKVGLKQIVIKSGKFKDIGSSNREMTDEEKAILQGVVDKLHRQFVRDLAKGRGLEEERVAQIADGRIYIGEEAVKLGLVDRLGNFEDAIALAGQKAGIEGRPKLIYPKKEGSLLSEILDSKSPLDMLPSWTRHPVSFQYLYLPGS